MNAFLSTNSVLSFNCCIIGIFYLQKLGVSSSDDRNTFKKELKVLKPFADKIKRDYDRKKREDKKRLEQEKKLAKKKK